MIAKFAKKINEILIQKGIVQKEDAELYQYGIENGIVVAGNLLASGIFGIVTGRPGLVLVFLLFYASLRSYSGGSHCKSRIGCFLISMAILFIPVYTYEPVMKNVPNAVILLIGVLAVKYAKNYISGALADMLDLGKGSGPMNHAFAIEGEYER